MPAINDFLNNKSKEEKEIKFDNVSIKVKQYLPVNDKLNLISAVINESADDLKFYNVGKLEIFKTLEIIKNYTNINFTDKQLEDVPKLYDLLVSCGLADEIINQIPEIEVS
jgi:hypothetical protein